MNRYKNNISYFDEKKSTDTLNKVFNLVKKLQTYLLADFFIDYLIKGDKPNISISELKDRLAELVAKSTTHSDKTSNVIATRR